MKKVIGLLLSLTAIISTGCEAQEKTLEYKVRPPKGGIKQPPLLILVHGLGSNEDDLFQLAEYLPPNYLIVSARAPYSAAENRYKWYDVDFSSGKPVINPEQKEESRVKLLSFLRELKSSHDFDTNKVFIGGFSQGAIMSYSAGLSAPDDFAGIIALSGRMLEATKSRLNDASSTLPRTLIIHGTQDRVLPVGYARQANTILKQKQAAVEYHEIDLGHSINNQTIQLLNAWLNKQ